MIRTCAAVMLVGALLAGCKQESVREAAKKQGLANALWKCEAPRIKAKVSVVLARRSYWDGSKMHPVGDRTYFVSRTPLVESSDLQSARLENFDGQKMLTFELSDEAAKRLESTTQDNVGQHLIIGLNGVETVAQLATAISMIPLAGDGVGVSDVCAE